jgi:hypothetical protein
MAINNPASYLDPATTIAVAPTTLGTVYTAPANYNTQLKSIIACNSTNSPVGITVSINNGSTSYQLFYFYLLAQQTQEFSPASVIQMTAGWTVQALATTASAVNLFIVTRQGS